MGDLLAGSDSENEIKFTINTNYASVYTKFREKEHTRHLKDFARSMGEDEFSTSDDDEDAKDLPKFEKGFFKVLSFMKNKDPRIYEENVTFYQDSPSTSVENYIKGESKRPEKKKKDKPFLLRDYERKLILERGGRLSDEEEVSEQNPRASSPTYVEEQKAIKDSFKQALQDSDEEEEKQGLGNLLKKKEKSEFEQQKEEADYKEWLKGRKSELNDKDTESDLKGLHDYWNDPNLNSDEVYLRDYILNKRFLESEDEDFEPAFNEIVHDDDKLENDLKYVDDQDSFEKKYNFRFEEPDPEFIKRYPRCVETSLRREDDRRKIKRQEIKERKAAEMATKREEIKQLKALKKKEILAKIEKIKQITGNDDLEFEDEDFEEDFSPEKHDKKMQELFNDNYYEVEEATKPDCLELLEELEIEDWENWQGKDSDEQYNGYGGEETWKQPQSEDPNFNMDCDYDPRAELQGELINMSKSKKKQRRRSKFAQAIAKEKPHFDPSNKKFEEYFEEYYKLDCEDIIGDLPCRFKYRKTTPNDYGLTVDEILRADVKELNKWCSLKKVVKYKPDHVEKYEVQDYKQKARNEALKRKILPSLYVSISGREDYGNITEEMTNESKNKRNKKKKYAKEEQDSNKEFESFQAGNPPHFGTETKNESLTEKKKKRKHNEYQDDEMQLNSSKKQKLDADSNDSTQKKSKEKRKQVRNEGHDTSETGIIINQKLKKEARNTVFHNKSILKKQNQKNKSHNYMKKKKNNFSGSDANIPISDVRLKAYGIHPKKFKNKIKYGNQQNAWS